MEELQAHRKFTSNDDPARKVEVLSLPGCRWFTIDTDIPAYGPTFNEVLCKKKGCPDLWAAFVVVGVVST